MATAETTLSPIAERVRIFEEVPELLPQLDAGDEASLRQITTRVLHLDPGIWTPKFKESELRGHLGLLALDGLLTRYVTVGETASAELLGNGDILRPWTEFDAEVVSIPSESRWQVVMPTRLAVLDARFVTRIAGRPEVIATIADRLVQRARWLSFHLAVCQMVGVEVRLLVVLWHLADRWGRVTPAGVKLPLPLTHGLLASIVGSRRPTVSIALSELRDQGLVERTDQEWILHGDPPVELHDLRVRVAARHATIEDRKKRRA
jgi:DNA-binding transcriptional ArsR family regulator